MGFHGGERGAGRRGGGTLVGEAGGGHHGGQEPGDPAWGAGKDRERVRRWGSWAGWCHRPTRDQGPPSPGVGLAEKSLGRPPTGCTAAAVMAHASLPGVFAGSHQSPVRLGAAGDSSGSHEKTGAQWRPGPTGGGGHRAAMLGRPEDRRGHSHTAGPVMLRQRQRFWEWTPGPEDPLPPKVGPAAHLRSACG